MGCAPAHRARTRVIGLHPAVWRFILAALIAASSCGGALTPVAADALAALNEARAAVERGDRDGAIARLESAVAQDRDLVAAYRWLSRLYADKGLRDKALDAAAAAALLDSDPADRDYLNRLVAGGLPDSMDRRTPEALPWPRQMAAIAAADDRLAGSPGPWETLVIAEEREAPATDPRFGWTCDRLCRGYVMDQSSQRWQAVLAVRYSASAGPARRGLATDCAGLILRAACLREAHLGSVAGRRAEHELPPYDLRSPLTVWVTDEGPAGAESWGANIYVCAASTPRAPAEWVRQLLHEYGHAALPGIDHFREPEPWANGRLGEQLFSQWLLRSAEGASGHPWLATADLRAPARDADRCVSAFLRTGPTSPLLSDRSAAGMDYYLGFANYVERVFGPRLLSSAMRMTVGAATRAFAVGVQEALRRAAEQLEVRAMSAPGSAGLTHWVYLPAGKWRARSSGAAVTFNGRAIVTRESDVGRVAEGWHAVIMPPGVTVTFILVEPSSRSDLP
jgi:tetratricopeptide (TPR) repeat protein